MRLLLPFLALATAEIDQEFRLDNSNSLLTGRMTPEMVKEFAAIAFDFLKMKPRSSHRNIQKKSKKPSFMDYDDTMSKQSLGIDAPAPMIMLNNDPVTFERTTIAPLRKTLSKSLPPAHHHGGMSRRKRLRKPTPSRSGHRRNGHARLRRKLVNP